MKARSIAELERIWTNVDGLKKMSDRVVGVGPLGIGLDGVLTWIPGVGDIYTVGVGGWLLVQAMRAHAPAGTLARMAGYLGVDTATAAVPFAGAVVDTFFPGHLMAAKALQKHIETTHWVEESWRTVRDSGRFAEHEAEMRAQRKKRVVFLRD
ncbi:MAG TPA: DUF4112 domain-containing protein [Caulobacteraceae bacterium]|nr:DUF4112 domain-containing protein [Caulobacteraceae bacterium]